LVGAWTLDYPSFDLSWSQATYMIFGCDPPLTAPSFAAMLAPFVPEEQARLQGYIQAAIAGQGGFEVTLTLCRPDGQLRQILLRAEREHQPGAGTIRLCGVIIDISDAGRSLSDLAQVYELLLARNRTLERFALNDSLTGLSNRRHFDEILHIEARRAQRSGLAFNDTYGHRAGDVALRAVCDVIAGHLRRAGDLAARYGGEEIAVLLPSTDLLSACRLAETMRLSVHAQNVMHARSQYGRITISAGVAEISRDKFLDHAGELVEAADQALYAAKHAGRNSVFPMSIYRPADMTGPSNLCALTNSPSLRGKSDSKID
jgi:diguanylate cyclase (GGDEF)-like protein